MEILEKTTLQGTTITPIDFIERVLRLQAHKLIATHDDEGNIVDVIHGLYDAQGNVDLERLKTLIRGTDATPDVSTQTPLTPEQLLLKRYDAKITEIGTALAAKPEKAAHFQKRYADSWKLASTHEMKEKLLNISYEIGGDNLVGIKGIP
jgi:hypothetical protein